MSVMQELHGRLAAGGVLLLDGGTGTELERRGAAMNELAWCADATETAPDMLREIHADYIRAGADIITANTYASSRIMLGAAGLADKVAMLNRDSVAIAREAREQAAGGRPVAVAGSISNMMHMVAGAARTDPTRSTSPDAAEASFREQATLLAEAGVDLLLLEMHYRPAYLMRSIRAARETGLPVWVGSSARHGRHPDGRPNGVVLSFAAEQDIPFDAVIDAILEAGADEVIGVMHTSVNVTRDALAILRKRWHGPMMAYPDSGYFEMPNWNFVDIIEPAALATEASIWIEQGAQVVGGCCGLGVEHIAALRAMLDERAAVN